MQKESRIVRRLLKFINQAPNSYAVKIHADGMQGKNTLDIVGGYLGIPFMVEIKTPTGDVSDAQTLLVKRFASVGYVTGIVTNIDDFKELFK